MNETEKRLLWGEHERWMKGPRQKRMYQGQGWKFKIIFKKINEPKRFF